MLLMVLSHLSTGKLTVMEDCVYDRISASHKVALLDLWMKYCDVICGREVLRYLQTPGGEPLA